VSDEELKAEFRKINVRINNGFRLMFKFFVLVVFLIWLVLVSCQGGDQPSVEATVEAIWHVEGTTNACPPYGIIALRAEWLAAVAVQKEAVAFYQRARREDKAAAKLEVELADILVDKVLTKCRMRCIETVVNNLARWRKAGRKECYLLFLGRRYVPESADPVGHRNWMRNMKSRLNDEPCKCRTKT